MLKIRPILYVLFFGILLESYNKNVQFASSIRFSKHIYIIRNYGRTKNDFYLAALSLINFQFSI